jgi:hypothetical protein
MLENAFLSLSGHGYLHDIRCYQSDGSYATLDLIYEFNNSQSDAVWLKCRFNRNQFPIFAKLECYLAKERSIILKFDAKYSGFQQCYTGQSESDPRFIVQLQGELLYVHDYYVEGVNAFYRNKQNMKNHNVLPRVRT